VLYGLLVLLAAIVVRRSIDDPWGMLSLSGSGAVNTGDGWVPVDEMLVPFESTAKLLRANDLRPRLLIKCYSDTDDTDVATLRKLAIAAGFEEIETEHVSWPSPVASRESP